MENIFLSKKGFKDLHKEVQRLEIETKSLTQQIREIGKAKSHDDRLKRSELMSYLEMTADKLSSKKMLLANAKPLPRRRDRLCVAVGSIVDIVDQQGRLFTYTIVNSLESNPNDGRISTESPLGKALLGLKRHDYFDWRYKSQNLQLQLVDIR